MGNTEAVEFLLKNGASDSIQDKNGNTPVDWLNFNADQWANVARHRTRNEKAVESLKIRYNKVKNAALSASTVKVDESLNPVVEAIVKPLARKTSEGSQWKDGRRSGERKRSNSKDDFVPIKEAVNKGEEEVVFSFE